MTFWQYCTLLLATFCLELVVYGLLLRRIFSGKQIAILCLILNVTTHPIVCLVFPRWLGIHYWIPAELFAWLAEGYMLLILARSMSRSRMRWTSALTISLAANAFSAGLGLLFSSYWQIP